MANMAKQAKAVLQTETIEAAADRGYFSAALHAVGADGTLGDVSTISEEAAARPPAVTACDGSRTGCRRVRFRVVAPQSSLESHAPSRHIDGTMVHGRALGRRRGDKLQCRASRARSHLRLLHLGL